jgi:hypothetical protein
LPVTIIFDSQTAGTKSGTLTILSNDPDHPSYLIALQAEALVPPIITVLPDSLAENLFTGGQSSQVITIDNTGGSNLYFDIDLSSFASADTKLFI